MIFELGRQESIDVADLRTTLGLDAGYLSRIRARLEDEGLVTRGTSGDDRRRHEPCRTTGKDTGLGSSPVHLRASTRVHEEA